MSAQWVLYHWIPFLLELDNHGINLVGIHHVGGSLVPEERMITLGYIPGRPLREFKEPWYGKDVYSHILFIDSDILWTYEDFEKLLLADKPIISGSYLKDEIGNLACAILSDDWKNHVPGSLLSLTLKDIEDKHVPFEVVSGAMGFQLVQHGVFEKISQPYFACKDVDLYKNGDRYLIGEDVFFSLNASYHGFSSWVHPEVVLPHVKRSAWTPERVIK
jgi:hypothetical protein